MAKHHEHQDLLAWLEQDDDTPFRAAVFKLPDDPKPPIVFEALAVCHRRRTITPPGSPPNPLRNGTSLCLPAPAGVSSTTTTAVAPIVNSSNAYLHQACLDPNLTVDQVERLLRFDANSVQRSVVLQGTYKPTYNPIRRCMQNRFVGVRYTYPLHLAIHNRLSPAVIERLIIAGGPSVLSMRDGSQQETPLMVLLKNKTRQQQQHLVALILREAPDCASCVDRMGNTALHIAVSRGVSSRAILTGLLAPGSLHHQNLRGKTPLDLCQQHTSTCSEEVATFLWEQTNRPLVHCEEAAFKRQRVQRAC